jgi:beta-lactamase class A
VNANASFLILILATGMATGASLRHGALQHDLERLTHNFDGRVGVCVIQSAEAACVNAKQGFSLQSVMKLVAGLAVLDAVDRGQQRLDDTILIQRKDLSLYVQPIADLVGKDGYRTTVGDLIRRAIVDSDSAAADILIAKLGGPPAVQSFLQRKGISGVRIDRDERHLQTEISGLTWRPEYIDPPTLEEAKAAVPTAERTRAYRRYQSDPRDTATPRGMASLLQKLAAGKLLSPSSTRYVMEVMEKTVTFPDRLKAGVPKGWTIAHKTGTSGSWQGVTAATNDVGILKTPDGAFLAIAVFIGDSKSPPAARSTLMAKIAAAAVAQYR